MPTYEYQCTKCNHRFDHFQSMSEKPLKKCPICKGKVERLISGGAGLIFKGSGFYITDYTRSDDYKKRTREDKSSSSSSSTNSSSSESKPKPAAEKKTSSTPSK